MSTVLKIFINKLIGWVGGPCRIHRRGETSRPDQPGYRQTTRRNLDRPSRTRPNHRTNRGRQEVKHTGETVRRPPVHAEGVPSALFKSSVPGTNGVRDTEDVVSTTTLFLSGDYCRIRGSVCMRIDHRIFMISSVYYARWPSLCQQSSPTAFWRLLSSAFLLVFLPIEYL